MTDIRDALDALLGRCEPAPNRTPAGTYYQIEQMMKVVKERAGRRAWTEAEVEYHVNRYGWAAYTRVSQAEPRLRMVVPVLRHIDSKRLLTSGDKLLPPCSHRDSVLMYDHRTYPLRDWGAGVVDFWTPPVAEHCRTCNAVVPLWNS